MKSRKRNRKLGFDYSQDGYYFITAVVQDRKNHFGTIKNGEMILNKYGKIVFKQWIWLHNQYKYLKLDEFTVMPNHFHGILCIDSNAVGTGRNLSLLPKHRDLSLRENTKIKSISELIGAFKTTSSKLIHKNGLPDFKWQRSFHDRIIRNDYEYKNIQNYIKNNSLNWKNDSFRK